MPDQIDSGEVHKLLDAIEKDLAQIKDEQPRLDALRREVASLRALVDEPEHESHLLRDALHQLSSTLDEAIDIAVAEGRTTSSYIQQIGRMLGM